MEKGKLVKKLKEFIEKSKLKNAKVETDLGLPKNSLSNFLSKKKILPDKWINPILKYILGDLSDKVTTADKIEPIEYEVKVTNDFDMKVNPMDTTVKINVAEWVKEIESFCEKEGITPADLIESYKSKNKPFKKISEIAENYVSNAEKLGLGNTSSYNPMNNPLFKSKMGIK